MKLDWVRAALQKATLDPALQGKTYRCNRYLKDLSLAEICPSLPPLLTLAIQCSARLSAIYYQKSFHTKIFLDKENKIPLKASFPSLNCDHEADSVIFAVVIEVITHSPTCRARAGTQQCCLLTLLENPRTSACRCRSTYVKYGAPLHVLDFSRAQKTRIRTMR